MNEAVITRIGHRGDGITEVEGATLHLPKVLPGEHVRLEHGRVVDILSPSPERIAPFCDHYASCGGCKLQHWQSAPYAQWKRDLLVEALAARGIVAEAGEMLDAHGRGRRRVSLHVRQLQAGWAAGFMEQKSHTLCAIGHCPVLVPELAAATALAADFGPVLGPCDVAVTAAANGLDVAVKAERKAVPRRIEALSDIVRRHGLIRLSVNGEPHTTLAAPVVKMGSAMVPLPVQSFLQATESGEAALAKMVGEGLERAKHVADLFCGIGPFALRLAERARVTAVDSDRAAIACLTQAVKATQGLKPVVARARDLFREPLVAAELAEFDGVVFDPPRAGAEAQARMLAKSKVKRVVAVACDVQTFARDAAILLDGGYKLKSVLPVDQFKWTAHLEMVAQFTRA